MVKLESDFSVTNYTPYLILTGEPWEVFHEFFKEKWLRYIKNTLE